MFGNNILTDLSIFNIVTSFTLFCYCTIKESECSLISHLGLYYSLPIYVIHPFIGYILNSLSLIYIGSELFQMQAHLLMLLPLIIATATIVTIYLYRIIIIKANEYRI